MTEDEKKYDAMIRACNISKEALIETGQMKGFMGIYNLGLETERIRVGKKNLSEQRRKIYGSKSSWKV